ncbi:DUF397 domain-containing protein [Actinomadura craniellae]|uniref:DUF397 domain-containing protein n=1 Tax=Actinomadura craniellae TaxID=2231787 RepID=A0A365H8S3_9ACTN|nr:DUF397 domain-containing protein [Actinomadura craniellae]RAY15534.1 DUF397 domain-containing protein [Actinomadura craniellae]
MPLPAWRKARRSMAQGGDCVEIARFSGSFGLRDSKNPDAGHLTFPQRVSPLSSLV